MGLVAADGKSRANEVIFGLPDPIKRSLNEGVLILFGLTIEEYYMGVGRWLSQYRAHFTRMRIWVQIPGVPVKARDNSTCLESLHWGGRDREIPGTSLASQSS